MATLRDYFDDPKAMDLFKSLPLPDQADVLQAIDPKLAREHLSNVHRLNQAKGAEAEAAIPGSTISNMSTIISAVPRVVGTVGGSVPFVGAIPAAIGETAAQGIEMAGGARENFNPYEVGVQAALGAIPGGMVAKTLKPATKLGARAAGAAEGAGMGALSTTASAAAQGRTPTASELGTGLGLGTIIGGASARRQAEPRPDYSEKSHNMLYSAIRPEAKDVREFSDSLDRALPYIYANRKGYVNSIADLEQAAKGTLKRLWDMHIEPVVAMNSHTQVDTSHIADSLRSKITRDTNPSVRKAIEREAAKYDNPRTLGELNTRIRDINAETRGLQEASGKAARTLRNDPKTAWKFDQLDNLRSTLADEAGKITGNPEVYMKLRKDWGALSEVADSAGAAAKRWEHQQKLESAAMLPGVQRTGKAILGGLGFGGTAAVRRGAGEAALEYMNNPDRMVRGAFKRLRFGNRMSSQFPEPQTGPERAALPAMGETGEPSIGDLQYRVPENRAAAKHARQRQEGSRLLTGQTREDFANQPAPGEPAPVAPGEMELTPGQVPRAPGAARTGPIAIAPPPDVRVKGAPPSKPRIRVPAAPGAAGPPPMEPEAGTLSGPILPVVKGSKLQSYAGPERRMSEHAVDVERRSVENAMYQAKRNPEVANQAAMYKDQADALHEQGDIRGSVFAENKWLELAMQHPWIADYLVNRTGVIKGGLRR